MRKRGKAPSTMRKRGKAPPTMSKYNRPILQNENVTVNSDC
jgi:hypothetical protein